MQEEGRPQPMEYLTRPLCERKKNNDTIQREFFAVIRNVFLLRPYLEWTKFIIRNDLLALRRILYLADATSKLTRWRLRLREFELGVMRRVGVKNRLRMRSGDFLQMERTISISMRKFPCWLSNNSLAKGNVNRLAVIKNITSQKLLLSHIQ